VCGWVNGKCREGDEKEREGGREEERVSIYG
jgi:hypothetical protein